MANHKELNFINKVLFLGLLALFFHNASGQETNEGEPGSGNSGRILIYLHYNDFLNILALHRADNPCLSCFR